MNSAVNTSPQTKWMKMVSLSAFIVMVTRSRAKSVLSTYRNVKGKTNIDMRHLSDKDHRRLQFDLFWAFLPQNERLIWQTDPEQWRALAEVNTQALLDDWPEQKRRDKKEFERMMEHLMFQELNRGANPVYVEEKWDKWHQEYLWILEFESSTVSAKSIVEFYLMKIGIPQAIQSGEISLIKNTVRHYGLQKWANDFFIEFSPRLSLHDILKKRNLSERYNQAYQGTAAL